jgi:hypothetical protein
MGACQCIHDPPPDACSTPANEAVVASGIRTERLRQVAPWGPRSQDPEDAIEDTAVIHPWNTTRLIRQERLDGRPLKIREFVAHDSRLHWELELRAGNDHQPATSVMIDTNSLTLLPLSRSYSRHSRICCWTPLGRKRPKADNYTLVSRAIKWTAGDSNVGNGQGVRWLDSGKLRPLYGAVDFRAVRRRSCTTSSVLLAKRRFGNRRGHRGCHPRIDAKTVPRRKLYRNRP